MRNVKLTMFKPSGKYYAHDSLAVPSDWAVFQIFDHIRDTYTAYKGMHILVDFNEDDEIGYPGLILAETRKEKHHE